MDPSVACALLFVAGYLRVNSEIVFVCPAPNGLFLNPLTVNCGTYYRCARSASTFLRCPRRFRFSVPQQMCLPRNWVDCAAQLARAAGNCNTPPANDGGRRGNHPGLRPNGDPPRTTGNSDGGARTDRFDSSISSTENVTALRY